jgi:hypothetical protein
MALSGARLLYPEKRLHVIVRSVSEWLKEASVLVLVFALLDKVVESREFGAIYVLEVLPLSIFLLAMGIGLEIMFGGEIS